MKTPIKIIQLNNVDATVKKILKNFRIKLNKYLDTLVFKQTMKILSNIYFLIAKLMIHL